jgi:transposase
MRGEQDKQVSMYVLRSPESLVPADHPLRRIKALADRVLARLSPTFDAMYSRVGRPSVPPECLLKSMLLIALYSVRSERQFCEQLRYNLLFRWFLDLDMVGETFDASTFSQNRERLLTHDVAGAFLFEVVTEARKASLMSQDHFTVDGTMIEAWASLKSFQNKARDNSDPPPPDDKGNPSVDFRGEKRSNATHESKTDPQAKLFRTGNGKEAKLSYMGHALMENRNGLVVDFRVSEANGTAEREEALGMLSELPGGTRRVTVAGDKGYDTRDFVARCRSMQVTPHVAQNRYGSRQSAVDARTIRHPGYTTSQRLRKRVEEIFGWMKTVGGLRKTRFRGLERNEFFGKIVAASYNLMRMSRLLAPQPT